MSGITPAEWTAILLSVRVAVMATLVATPFGIALAWLLARRDFWGKAILDAAVHLPLVLPPVVTGYLLLLTFGRRGMVGAWLADHLGIVFAFRWTGAAPACGVMSFPLLVRPIRLSIEAIDRRLEQASSTLGAAPWQVFATVKLPLALPGGPAGAAGRARRHGARLRQGDRRVRRHHPLRLQHSRRDPDHFLRDLFANPDPRRRHCGGAAGADFHRDRDGRPDRLRMVCAARHQTPAR